MIKYKNLRQQWIKLSLVVVITVSALGAGAYATYSMGMDADERLRKAESKARSMSSDLSARRERAEGAEKYMGLYQQLKGDAEQEKLSDLNREKAQKWLSNLAKELNVSKLEGDAEPVANIETAAFNKKTLQGVTSRVKLSFAAMTDEQLYRFVQAIANNFPGYVKITRVNFEKSGEIDDATLIAAGRGNFPELVSGSIEFNWIAVKAKTPANSQSDGRG